MKKEDISKLIDRWTNEPGFREQMRKDPIKTLKGAGLVLDKTDVKALKNVDWSLSDEELKARANML